MVGERSVRCEAKGVTHGGAYGSENAGASNRNACEIHARRNSEVSLAMLISQGLVGPKGIPKGGLDGQMVNIPSPLICAKEGRSVVLQATYRLVVRAVRRVSRKIRAPYTPSGAES